MLRSVAIEQYGILYPHLVNAVRKQIPASVEQRTASVTDVELAGDVRTVHLDAGDALRARLVVVACGTGSRLYEALGVRDRVLRAAHSLSSGFDIARTDGRPFAFDALTCYPDTTRDRIDYVSLFAIPGRMRVNLFATSKPPIHGPGCYARSRESRWTTRSPGCRAPARGLPGGDQDRDPDDRSLRGHPAAA